MTAKFEVIINFHRKMLHLLIQLLDESLSNTSNKVQPNLHIFPLILSLLLVYTAIIVLMMLHCNLFPFFFSYLTRSSLKVGTMPLTAFNTVMNLL